MRYIYPAIEAWMEKAGISQRAIAEKAGYCQKTVSLYLTGATPPSYYFILTVLEMSGMTFEEAFRRGENNGLS